MIEPLARPWAYELVVLQTQILWLSGMIRIDTAAKNLRYADILIKFAEVYHKYGHDQKFIDESREMYNGLQRILTKTTFGSTNGFPPLVRL